MAVKKDDKAQTEPDKKVEPQEPSQTPDYAKQFAELKTQFEESEKKRAEEMGQVNEFVAGASVVINTLATDENLRKGFQEALNRQSGVQTQQPTQTTPTQPTNPTPQNSPTDVTKKVDDVVSSQRESIIRDFENSVGIKNDEEGKVQRQKVAEYLNGFGWKVADLPLTTLRESLEKAYVGSVGVEKLREEGKLEGIATMRTNAMGTMGSFSSSAPNPSEQTGELNAKQQEWLKKLRVKDVEGAKKLYNDRENEKDREKEVKE